MGPVEDCGERARGSETINIIEHLCDARMMAGGTSRGRAGIPLSERVSSSQVTTVDCPARHCWVAGGADDLVVKRPGLLVEWRHTDADEWEGLVVYAARLNWAQVEEWLPGSYLTAAR